MLSSCAVVHKKRYTAAVEWCTSRTMDVFQAHDFHGMFDKHPNDEDMLEHEQEQNTLVCINLTSCKRSI